LHSKKHISFSGLRKILSERFAQCSDPRHRAGIYDIHDCLMSAFAMMFFQDPSLLQFQKRLQDAIQKNNLTTLFGVSNIPGDTQLRDTIDSCDPQQIEAVFSDYFALLQRGKQLESFRVLDGYYLIPIDGTQYFSSEKIHCPQCLYKKSSRGLVRYHHQILQAAIVCPDRRQVIPLAPEPVQNSDGREKQDCEINAGKRMLKKIRQAHPKLRIIIGGDSLYSKQPFIAELKANRMSFILVAKPADHKNIFQWVQELRQMGETQSLTFTDFKNRVHHYEWVNDLPINANPKSDLVSFFEYRLVVDGKITYRNSWVTDFEVTAENVIELVKAGRARWKIENETFNTLKNQGYHIEHNYGHGKQNLSYNFFLLNLLAFFFHQILELSDRLYQTCRAEKFTSRREFWNQLRCTIRILVFENWEQILWLILDPENNRPP
jgi:hypothetical protein